MNKMLVAAVMILLVACCYQRNSLAEHYFYSKFTRTQEANGSLNLNDFLDKLGLSGEKRNLVHAALQNYESAGGSVEKDGVRIGLISKSYKRQPAGFAHLQNLLPIKEMIRGLTIEMQGSKKNPNKGEDSAFLTNFKNLEHLRISDYRTSNPVEWLSGLPHLTSLQLDRVDVDLSRVNHCRYLKLFIISHVDLMRNARGTDNHASHIDFSACSDLMTVVLNDCQGLSTLPGICGSKSIQSLSIHHGDLSSETLNTSLQNLPGIERLRITYCPSVRACTFGSHSKLTELDMSGCPIDDETMKSIARCPELTKLEVGVTEISDDSLIEIGKLKKIAVLKLPNGVRGYGLTHLAKGNSLRELDLRQCKHVRTSDLSTLKHLPLSTLIVPDFSVIDVYQLKDDFVSKPTILKRN